MKHLIIGTAGHVDHGKTALVKALTGIDTDRLKEEKDRGISIELGFAALSLPGVRRAGIVDVHGHERFIKNMLAGAGGFDLVLLVIAADEGVMPQTREHLDIIQLLQVTKGIVVLTKIDLVDQEWLELVQEEVRDFLKGTVLENAPVVSVSSVTGQGIPELLEQIDSMTREVRPRVATGPPRLPVDRVFHNWFRHCGHGTLVSGTLQVGDQVEVQPQGLASRVRSLQVHGEKVEVAEAGQRVAVNLVGLEVEQIERGSVVAGMNSMFPTKRLDVRLLLLKSAPRPLKNGARVRFFLGTREALGRVRLLDQEELKPGSLAYAQLELEKPVVADKGDRFVIRSYSPMHTIGGGTVITLRAQTQAFSQRCSECSGSPGKGYAGELLSQCLPGLSGLPGPAEVAKSTGLEEEDILEAARELERDGRVKMIIAEEDLPGSR